MLGCVSQSKEKYVHFVKIPNPWCHVSSSALRPFGLRAKGDGRGGGGERAKKVGWRNRNHANASSTARRWGGDLEYGSRSGFVFFLLRNKI